MSDDDEDLAAQKEKEEAEKKAAEEKAKAEEEAKKKAEEAKKKAEAEEAEKKKNQAQQGALTEEQWLALEKNYGMPRGQILANWSMIQAAQANSPANRLLEKDALEEAKKGITDISFYSEDVDKAIAAMTPQDRQDARKVRKEIMAVRGEKMKSAGDGARRVATGLSDGSSGEPVIKETDMPEFTGAADEKHDQKEVFEKFGFKDAKEWKAHQSREIPVDERNFVPKWK